MNRSFEASMDQLQEILDFIREEIGKAGFRESSLNQLELALEEAVVNIIKYAYPKTEGKISVECECLHQQKKLNIVLIDNGVPFNPTLKHSKTDLNAKKGEPIGGYGIFLIFKIMDHVEYEFKEGHNILRLTKMVS